MSTVTFKPSYTGSATLTITLASLGSSSTLVAGEQSTVVSNLSNLYDDVLLSVKVTTGTSPTVNTEIDVWIFAPVTDDLASSVTYPDTFGATDAAVTVTSLNVRNAAIVLAGSIIVDNTSNRTYFLRPTSLARLFGGHLPTRWGVWITQNTGAALDSTAGNHAVTYIGVQDVAV